LSVKFAAAERRLSLLEGPTTFTVARDAARTFIVEAGDGQTRAVGTVFDIDIRADEAIVTVVEGVVAITTDQAPDPVVARVDQRVRYFPRGKPSAPETTNAEIETARPRGKLVFNRRPLAGVVADVERYRRGTIVLVGDGLRSLEVTGVFDLNDPEAILRTIKDTLPVRMTRLPFITVCNRRKQFDSVPLRVLHDWLWEDGQPRHGRAVFGSFPAILPMVDRPALRRLQLGAVCLRHDEPPPAPHVAATPDPAVTTAFAASVHRPYRRPRTPDIFGKGSRHPIGARVSAESIAAPDLQDSSSAATTGAGAADFNVPLAWKPAAVPPRSLHALSGCSGVSMLDSEVTNIAALESCIGKTPGRCIFRIVLAQPRAAIAVLIPMPKMPACHAPGSIVGSRTRRQVLVAFRAGNA
jgi:hypothetical protein